MESTCPCMKVITNPKIVGGVLGAINLSVLLIYIYDLTIINLITYSSILFFAFLYVVLRCTNCCKSKNGEEECAREFFIDEDQLKTFYIYAYEHTNSAIQLLRKIILGTNKALTLKVLTAIYITSYFTSFFGDFLFIILLINGFIVYPLINHTCGSQIKNVCSDLKKKIETTLEDVMKKIPKYEEKKE